jgi:Carboxypeptidase regulatory-like domain
MQLKTQHFAVLETLMRNFVLRILILLFVPSSFLLAQGSVAGSITGIVTDPQGAVISGAVVTISSAAMLTPKSEKSVAGGVYLVENLPPGEYEITCSLPGFKNFLEKGVVLTAGFTATVNIGLALGDASETVTVSSSDTPIVDVESGSTPITFDSMLLANTPSGNDPWSTLAQTPGVTVSTFDVGGNNSYQQSSMSVHGSKTTETVYAFNGLDLNGASGSSTSYYVDQYSYSEIQMITDASPPEVPIGGAYMNMITRQGSNAVHGFTSFNYEDDKTQRTLVAPNYTPISSVAALGAVAGPVLTDGSPFIRAYDFAADVGGPIIKDRWWIFGAYREYQLKQQLRASPLPNPVTGAPPPTTNPGLYGFGTDVNHQSNTTLRNDFQINSKNVVNAIWHWQYINRFFRRSGGTYVDQAAAYVQIEPAYIVQAQEIYSPTSHLTIDSRIGYLNLIFPERYQPTVAGTTVPGVDIGQSTVKYAGEENYVNKQKIGRVASTASYFHGGWMGSHNFKVGVDFSINRNYSIYNFNQEVFDEYDTTNAALAPDTTPYEILVKSGPVDYNDWAEGHSVFVQDAWTINRHVTLNIGGRYDYSHAWIPSQCNPSPGVTAYSPLFPNRCTAQFQAAYATQAAAGETLGPLTPYNNVDTYNNFVPRISVAYDPTGKGNQVIRGGFNMYTNNVGTSLADSTNPNSVATATYGWNGSFLNGGTAGGFCTAGAINSCTPDYTKFAPACGLNAPGTAGCLASGTYTGKAANGGGGWFSTTGGFASYIDPNLKRPYSIMYNAEYQRSLFRNIQVAIAYYHRDNKGLQTTANINAPTSDYTPVTTYLTGANAGQPILNPLTGAAMTLYNLTGSSKTCLLAPLYTARSTTDVGCSYTETTNNPLANNNHYNGVEFTLTRRLTGRWSALVGLTIQSDKGTQTGGDFNDPNLNINRFGSIDQDVPYVVRADVTYKLPYKIQASVNFQHETGSPILPTNSFNVGLNQGSETVNLEPNGNLRYPSVNDTNIRVARVTPIGERFTLETNCDLNNLFNVSPTTAETVTYGTAFLKPSTFLGPFIARFGMKLSF